MGLAETQRCFSIHLSETGLPHPLCSCRTWWLRVAAACWVLHTSGGQAASPSVPLAL